MTEGGNVNGPAPRLRIKGRWQSVVRFFSISVAFMILWILVTSQLGHYSKLFGPQILLQLNLAFYLPSIPVLLISGSLERLLDGRLGPVGSIGARLTTGLAGCGAVAAAFPLLPGLIPGDGPLWPLLSAVGVLGGLSAVAFSTSYQLVQFFRAADTIGLGVGCVGAGPLVLLLQLGLGVGPSPAKWQWIAMYEICAGVIAAGLLSASSLCAQYWKQLNTAAARSGGAAAAAARRSESRVPLLAAAADDAAAAAAAAAADAEADWPAMKLADASGHGGYPSPASLYGSGGGEVYVGRPLSAGGSPARGLLPRRAQPGSVRRRPPTAPDPFNIFSLLTPELDGGFDWGDDECDSAPPVLLRRAASAGVEDSRRSAAAAARRREALAAAGLDRSAHHARSRPSTTAIITTTAAFTHNTTTSPTAQRATALLPTPHAHPSAPPPSPVPPMASPPSTALAAATPAEALPAMASAPAKMMRRSNGSAAAAATAGGAPASASGLFGDVLEFGVLDEQPVVQGPDGGVGDAAAAAQPPPHLLHGLSYGESGSSFATASASELLSRALQLPPPKQGKLDAADGSGAVGTLQAATAATGSEEQVAAAGGQSPLCSTLQSLEAEAAVAAMATGGGGEGGVGKAEGAGTDAAAGGAPMTLHQEVVECLRGSWQVMLGFTVDVTLLYVVFPFFTYVPASGWLGDSLPQVLFYSRLFTDLAGRLLPRRRALQLRSGTAVLALAALSTAAGALFFAYILAPPAWREAAPGLLRNDAVPLGLVVFLWLTGGYTNTASNMLAPALVAPHLAGRASALMALLFNVAHIGGLLVAATLAAAIFGDVVG